MSGTHATDAAPPSAGQLRAAIARDYVCLCRTVATLVRRAHGRMPFDQVHDRVGDVVDEAVRRALERAESYDPDRPAFSWVMAFATNVFRESRRDAAPRGRPISYTDLGDAGWEKALEAHVDPDARADAADLRRLRRAKAKLTEADRRLIDLRVERGLDGAGLARETGAPTAGAARVRLSRALAALRKAYDREPPGDDDVVGGDDDGVEATP